MAVTFLFLGWIGLGFWVLAMHRAYLEANRVRVGLDRVGAPLGGLKPILPAGLFFGLNLAWVGPWATVVLVAVAFLLAFLIDRVRHFSFSHNLLPSVEVSEGAGKKSSAF